LYSAPENEVVVIDSSGDPAKNELKKAKPKEIQTPYLSLDRKQIRSYEISPKGTYMIFTFLNKIVVQSLVIPKLF